MTRLGFKVKELIGGIEWWKFDRVAATRKDSQKYHPARKLTAPVLQAISNLSDKFLRKRFYHRDALNFRRPCLTAGFEEARLCLL